VCGRHDGGEAPVTSAPGAAEQGRDIPTTPTSRQPGEAERPISLTDLIAGDPATNVGNLMHTDIITIPEEADQETVARLFAEHGLTAAPVSMRPAG